MKGFAEFGTICTIQKLEKYRWKIASACNFTKSITPPWVFLRFLNYSNATKLRNTSQITPGLTIPYNRYLFLKGKIY